MAFVSSVGFDFPPTPRSPDLAGMLIALLVVGSCG